MPKAIKTVPLWFTAPGPFAPEVARFKAITRTVQGLVGLAFEVDRADGKGPATVLLPVSLECAHRLHASLDLAEEKGRLLGGAKPGKPTDVN